MSAAPANENTHSRCALCGGQHERKTYETELFTIRFMVCPYAREDEMIFTNPTSGEIVGKIINIGTDTPKT